MTSKYYEILNQLGTLTFEELTNFVNDFDEYYKMMKKANTIYKKSELAVGDRVSFMHRGYFKKYGTITKVKKVNAFVVLEDGNNFDVVDVPLTGLTKDPLCI